MLMNPTGAIDAYDMFRRSLPLMIASFSDREISGTLKQIDRMVGEGHVYEALKAIRSLYPLERKALGENDDQPPAERQARASAGKLASDFAKHDAQDRNAAGGAR
jgi:flagellar protein FlbT